MIWILAAGAILVIIVIIARRGQPRHRGSSGSLGHAMQNLEGLFVESKKYVIEARREEESEEDDSGDPPEK